MSEILGVCQTPTRHGETLRPRYAPAVPVGAEDDVDQSFGRAQVRPQEVEIGAGGGHPVAEPVVEEVPGHDHHEGLAPHRCLP